MKKCFECGTINNIVHNYCCQCGANLNPEIETGNCTIYAQKKG